MVVVGVPTMIAMIIEGHRRGAAAATIEYVIRSMRAAAAPLQRGSSWIINESSSYSPS
jgi:hypothetical protein